MRVRAEKQHWSDETVKLAEKSLATGYYVDAFDCIKPAKGSAAYSRPCLCIMLTRWKKHYKPVLNHPSAFKAVDVLSIWLKKLAAKNEDINYGLEAYRF